MDFSQAVELAMKRAGVKRTELAKATGYTYQHISDLLNSKRRWNEESLNKVCLALGLEVNLVTPDERRHDIAFKERDINELTQENQELKKQVSHLKTAIKELTEIIN